MCERDGEATDVEKQENAALDKIFMDCDPSSRGTAPVAALLEYMRVHMTPNEGSKLLDELKKSLCTISSRGLVTREQFFEVSRRWIIKQRRRQDGNNNLHDRPCDALARHPDLGQLDNATPSESETPVKDEDQHDHGVLDIGCGSSTVDFLDVHNMSSYSTSSVNSPRYENGLGTASGMDKDFPDCKDSLVGTIELRSRIRELGEDNAALRDELVRAEDYNATLRQQIEIFKRKCERMSEKCERLEKEIDEQKELLSAVEKELTNYKLELQRVERERSLLTKEYEKAESKLERIPVLKEKLEMFKKKEKEYTKQRLEYEEIADALREKILELEDANKNLQGSYESSLSTVTHLRETVQLLQTEVSELKLMQDPALQLERLSTTPPTSSYNFINSTPCRAQEIQQSDSLCAELKASGFSIETSRINSSIHELEEEINGCKITIEEQKNELMRYTSEIPNTITHLEKVARELALSKNNPETPILPPTDDELIEPDLQRLKHVTGVLALMVAEIVRETKNGDSEVRAEGPPTIHQSDNDLNIMSFHDYILYRSKQNETANDFNIAEVGSSFTPSMSQYSLNISSNSPALPTSPFLDTTLATTFGEYLAEGSVAPSDSSSTSGLPPHLQEQDIISPIVAALDKIIDGSSEENTPREQRPTHRRRNTYTLPSGSLNQDTDLSTPETVASSLDSPEDLDKVQCAASSPAGGDFLTFDHLPSDNFEDRFPKNSPGCEVEPNQTASSLEGDVFQGGERNYKSGGSLRLEDVEALKSTLEKLSLRSSSSSQNQDSEVENSYQESINVAEELPQETESSSVNTVKCLQTSGIEESYHETPTYVTKSIPKRKTSVFHRCFDYSALQPEDDCGKQASVEQLLAKSPTVLIEETKRDILATNVVGPSFHKSFDLATWDSGSSDSLSPIQKSRSRSTDDVNEGIAGEQSAGDPLNQQKTKPFHFAPSKLNSQSTPIDSTASANNTRMTTKNAGVFCYEGNSWKSEKLTFGTSDRNPFDIGKFQMKDQRASSLDGGNVASSQVPEGTGSLDAIRVLNFVTNTDETNSFVVKSDTRQTIIPFDAVTTRRHYRFGNEISLDNVQFNESYIIDHPSLQQIRGREDTKDFAPSTDLILQGSHEITSSGIESPASSQPLRNPGSKMEKPFIDSEEAIISPPAVPDIPSPMSSTNKSTFSAPSVPSRGCGVVDLQIRDSSSEPRSSSREVVAQGHRGLHERDNESAAVQRAMSSGEDSSDSECSPVIVNGNHHVVVAPLFASQDEPLHRISATPAEDKDKDRGGDRVLKITTPERQRRSMSESDGSGGGHSECRCRVNPQEAVDIFKEKQVESFPSLPDSRLRELGLANAPEGSDFTENLPEDELERKYKALSVSLGTDRITLPRRVALSLRHRDQAERNLASEVQRMHQDIQALAPLCVDRESVERVERVRHQLEMIAQCAHRVSCAAEMLGAAHQEHRVSRAALLADRYLQVLRTRCDKLAAELVETKRILTENNIVVEENPGELGDEVPRVRYCGVLTPSRTMTMSRRRASIAAISRPLSSPQDLTKEGVRQRNSVSGRMTLRRPSLTHDNQKWDEKLDRTDSSSSSIGELREIFEQAESRRSSREENNNLVRSLSSNFSIGNCESSESDVWANPREEPSVEPAEVEICPESRLSRRTSQVFRTIQAHVPQVPLFWMLLIAFILGCTFMHVVSSMESQETTFRWWSWEELLEKYVHVAHMRPPPI